MQYQKPLSTPAFDKTKFLFHSPTDAASQFLKKLEICNMVITSRFLRRSYPFLDLGHRHVNQHMVMH